jgi:hypothetical protein
MYLEQGSLLSQRAPTFFGLQNSANGLHHERPVYIYIYYSLLYPKHTVPVQYRCTAQWDVQYRYKYNTIPVPLGPGGRKNKSDVGGAGGFYSPGNTLFHGQNVYSAQYYS